MKENKLLLRAGQKAAAGRILKPVLDAASASGRLLKVDL
jgi:hypothetical protein